MKTPAHNHRFEVVWQGRWYLLGSFSDHLKYKVDPTGPVRLLTDKLYNRTLVPAKEIHIPPNPLP